MSWGKMSTIILQLGQYVHLQKVCAIWGKMSWGKMSLGHFVLGHFVLGAKCPWGKMSVGQNVLGANVPKPRIFFSLKPMVMLSVFYQNIFQFPLSVRLSRRDITHFL
jgi:hypothetical protein